LYTPILPGAWRPDDLKQENTASIQFLLNIPIMYLIAVEKEAYEAFEAQTP
jgi:hypothetical protein